MKFPQNCNTTSCIVMIHGLSKKFASSPVRPSKFQLPCEFERTSFG